MIRECNTNCEFDCETVSIHLNMLHPQGNDTGEQHTCASSPGGCNDHSCLLEEQNIDLAELAGALPELTGPDLRALAAEYERFSLNRDREAVQVLGCDDKVLLSLNLSRQQAAELSGAADR